MPNRFYKIRKNRLVAGVLAGLADNLAGTSLWLVS